MIIKFLKSIVDTLTNYAVNQQTEEWSKSTKIDPNIYHLKLDRVWYSGKSTIGKLFVDGKFECYILEDKVRNEKKYGETAIPEGRYEIVITHSPRFKTKLPLLKKVPNFRGVRIHPGNTHKDTEGCLLPGETRDIDFVGRSRRAFNALFKKLQQAKKERKKIWLTIKS